MKAGWIGLTAAGLAVGAWGAGVPVALPGEDLPAGVTVSEDGVWKVVYAGAGSATFPVTTISALIVGEEQYAVVGEVRYQGVAGQGYLEMWNHFAGEKAFFTRTLGERGPMQAITGDADWRRFALPFNKGTEPDPEKLVINLVLAGPGTVELRGLTLAPGRDWMNAQHPGAWWSPRFTGLLGAVLGCTAGLLGMLIGLGMKSPPRIRLARTCVSITLALGGVSLLGFLAALAARQPWHVQYLFLLFGVIGLVVGGDAFRKVRRQQTESELRHMDAADAARP